MIQRVLVMVKQPGLSQNLIGLALQDPKFDIEFSEPEHVQAKGLRKFSHIIADDNSITAQNLKNLLVKFAKDKKVVYLTNKTVANAKGFTCLTKPFHPSELKKILIG